MKAKEYIHKKTFNIKKGLERKNRPDEILAIGEGVSEVTISNISFEKRDWYYDENHNHYDKIFVEIYYEEIS